MLTYRVKSCFIYKGYHGQTKFRTKQMGMKGFSDASDKSILFQNSILPSSEYLLGTEFLLQKTLWERLLQTKCLNHFAFKSLLNIPLLILINKGLFLSFLKIHFIYLGLHCIFVAAYRLLPDAIHRHLTAVASLIVEQGPQGTQAQWFSSCKSWVLRAQAQRLCTGLIALRHVGSSWTRDHTVSPTLASGFSTTGPPGKSDQVMSLGKQARSSPKTVQGKWNSPFVTEGRGKWLNGLIQAHLSFITMIGKF